MTFCHKSLQEGKNIAKKATKMEGKNILIEFMENTPMLANQVQNEKGKSLKTIKVYHKKIIKINK